MVAPKREQVHDKRGRREIQKVEEGTQWALSGWSGTVALPKQTSMLGLLGVKFIIPSLMQAPAKGWRVVRPPIPGHWEALGFSRLSEVRIFKTAEKAACGVGPLESPARQKLRQEAFYEFRDNLDYQALFQNQTATGKIV